MMRSSEDFTEESINEVVHVHEIHVNCTYYRVHSDTFFAVCVCIFPSGPACSNQNRVPGDSHEIRQESQEGMREPLPQDQRTHCRDQTEDDLTATL